MSVMAPQQVLLSAVLPDGSPALPNAIQIPDGPLVPVWDDVQRSDIGGAVFWEYRHWATGRLVLLQLVAYTAYSTPVEPDEAPVPLRAALVVWAPALERLGRNPVYQALAPVTRAMGLLHGAWDIEHEEGGAFVVPTLDADALAEAAEVKAAWPEDWRTRVPTDSPALPSGPRCLGLVIA